MTPSRPSASFLDALVRVGRRHRRWLAALAAFVAVYSGLSAVRPAGPPTVEVVAARHAVAPGTTLAESDLTLLRVPPDTVPEGAHRAVPPLVGVTVNVSLPARAIVTDAVVAAGRAVARPGYVVLALPLNDAALASVLQPGALIDLLSPGRQAPVASGVRVLAFPDARSGSVLSTSSRAILVEVPAAAGAAVAEASEAGRLTIALH